MMRPILVDYLVMALIFLVANFLISSKRIRIQKANFLKSKKIQSLLTEQMKIF